jgi:hypothetical protein
MGYTSCVVLLGLIVAAVAVGFVVDVVLENTDNIDVVVLGRTFEVRPGLVVVAGVATAVVLAIGFRLARIGVRRLRKRRVTLREARDVLAAREDSTPTAREEAAPADIAPASLQRSEQRVADGGEPLDGDGVVVAE